MRQGDEVRFDLMSSLPLEAFKPFIKKDGPLEQALEHVTLRRNLNDRSRRSRHSKFR
jgi:hypothetical protein